MTRAILKTIAFSLVILASAAAINWFVVPNNPDAYQAAKLDKLELLRTTPSPKLILLGGSNLAFSIDSEWLSERLGMPVVNMGLAKSVGLEYLLEETKPHIHRDDIVVIAVEYELFYDLYFGSDGLIVELQYVPTGFEHLNSFGQWSNFVSKFGPIMQAKFAGYLRKGPEGQTDEIYRRSGFNRFGDLITHLDEEPAYETHELFEHGIPFREESIKLLNDFYQAVLERGARVYFSAPPLVDHEFDRHQEKILDLYAKLHDGLKMPVISDPSEYVFRHDQMYDTAYHLLREGSRLRTEKLLSDLQNAEGIGVR
jgi:hypothetical protein